MTSRSEVLAVPPSHILSLPDEIIGLILEQSDEYVWSSLRGTCRRIREISNEYMSEETAARRVFRFPALYVGLREKLKISPFVAQQALTRDPSLFGHPAIPECVRGDQWMAKIALVAARILGDVHLSFSICSMHQEPSFLKLVEDLDSAIVRLKQSFFRESHGDLLPQESDLWKMPAFMLRYFSPHREFPGTLADEADCFATGHDEVIDNKDLVLSISKSCPEIVKYCSIRLQEDEGFVLELLRIKPELFLDVSARLQNDKVFIMRAMANPYGPGGDFLKFVGARFKNDEDVVLAAIQHQKTSMNRNVHTHLVASVLQFADVQVRDSFLIVEQAVKRYSSALRSASVRLRDDKRLVLLAFDTRIREFDEAYKTYSQDDLGLFEQNKRTLFPYCMLSLVSDRLRDDPEIVLKAVLSNYVEVRYASERLKNDKVFISEVLKINKEAIQFVGVEIRDDFDA